MSAHRHVDMGCRKDETCGCGLVPVQYTYGELESLNLRAQRSGLGIEVPRPSTMTVGGLDIALTRCPMCEDVTCTDPQR
ncbi:Uncharacterised protein [Mycobacteroides abscessus subsp. massiliense]|nr:Uncharacterised protein [Mycobacteroides abscessus subsp. massiliense]